MEKNGPQTKRSSDADKMMQTNPLIEGSRLFFVVMLFASSIDLQCGQNFREKKGLGLKNAWEEEENQVGTWKERHRMR